MQTAGVGGDVWRPRSRRAVESRPRLSWRRGLLGLALTRPVKFEPRELTRENRDHAQKPWSSTLRTHLQCYDRFHHRMYLPRIQYRFLRDHWDGIGFAADYVRCTGGIDDVSGEISSIFAFFREVQSGEIRMGCQWDYGCLECTEIGDV